jgi:hypothetical protein
MSTPNRTFALYPEARHWWSLADYGAVLDTMLERKPRRVLEFGPGSSTLALIEGGARTVDTCEDSPDWAAVYEDRLQGKYPEVVHVHRYTWSDQLSIPAIDGQTYDLALIDGPLGTDRRPTVVEYCLDRCEAVLLPTEDSNPRLRQFLHELAEARGLDLVIRETGPLSGGFALLTKRPIVPSPALAEDAAQVEECAPHQVSQSASATVTPVSRKAAKRQAKRDRAKGGQA